jgi:hypothetical protein
LDIGAHVPGNGSWGNYVSLAYSGDGEDWSAGVPVSGSYIAQITVQPSRALIDGEYYAVNLYAFVHSAFNAPSLTGFTIPGVANINKGDKLQYRDSVKSGSGIGFTAGSIKLVLIDREQLELVANKGAVVSSPDPGKISFDNLGIMTQNPNWTDVSNQYYNMQYLDLPFGFGFKRLISFRSITGTQLMPSVLFLGILNNQTSAILKTVGRMGYMEYVVNNEYNRTQPDFYPITPIKSFGISYSPKFTKFGWDNENPGVWRSLFLLNDSTDPAQNMAYVHGFIELTGGLVPNYPPRHELTFVPPYTTAIQ